MQQLRHFLSNHIGQPQFAGALWGIKIASLATGKTIFETNAHKLFSPASNSKLFTVALALDRLGQDYRIRTSLYVQSKPDREGTLVGDLLLYGRGDPSISARFHGGNINNALKPFAIALTNAGIKEIHGDLIADESWFRGPAFGSGWSCQDLEHAYGARISALSINDNVFQVSVSPGPEVGSACQVQCLFTNDALRIQNRATTVAHGQKRNIHFSAVESGNAVYVWGEMPAGSSSYVESLPVNNPARCFGATLNQCLTDYGVKLTGQVRTVGWLDRQTCPESLDQWLELSSIDSLPLKDIAREILKPSQNLYADLLLAHLGEKFRGQSADKTSEQLGIEELGKFLSKAGVHAGELIFDEGSGLSRNNLLTPEAAVALLQFMAAHPLASTFVQALPIAGADGTLRLRMKGSKAEGNVRAKTGTLRWVDALAGYVSTAAGERLAFSIMLNRFNAAQGVGEARLQIDAIPIKLAEFTGHSDDL